MEEIVKALLEQLAQANATIVELSKLLAEVKKPEPYFEPPVISRQYPLYVPESEEDARAAFAAGDITKEQLQGVLDEIEFFNNEITVPTSW